MSDNDATQARQDVAADVDEIIEHVINANMLSMPYDVYSELFDAVDGLGVKIEKLQSENAKLRELARLEHECNAHAQLCEFCPHNGIDFEHEDISCDVTDNIERLRSELDVEGK